MSIARVYKCPLSVATVLGWHAPPGQTKSMLANDLPDVRSIEVSTHRPETECGNFGQGRLSVPYCVDGLASSNKTQRGGKGRHERKPYQPIARDLEAPFAR